jgi:HSP20 family protein
MLRMFWDDSADPVRRLVDPMLAPRFARSGLGIFDGRLMPSTEIYADKGDLIVRVELAGVDPQKDVTVMIDNHELVIRGERKREAETKDKVYYRRETEYGAFERRIPLPESIDDQSIQAQYKDGFLEITVQGAAKAMETDGEKARVIPVTTSTEPNKVETSA